MPKQTVTIEVDVPEGFELTGEYRVPQVGEVYISDVGFVKTVAIPHDFKQFIIRKSWQWPFWLKADCIVQSDTGRWFACIGEPSLTAARTGWSCDCFEVIDTKFYDFTPPPCTDWRQSKRRRPTS